jgi:hypothetical protein
MALAISDLTDALRFRRYAALIPLLTLTLYQDQFGTSPVSTSIRLSDRTRYLPRVAQADLEEYAPLVLDWGSVGHAMERIRPDISPQTAEIVLSNARQVGGETRFTDLIRHGFNLDLYDLALARVQVHLMFEGGVLGTDDLLIFDGILDTITSATRDTLALHATSTLGTLERLLIRNRVSACSGPSAYMWNTRLDELFSTPCPGGPTSSGQGDTHFYVDWTANPPNLEADTPVTFAIRYNDVFFVQRRERRDNVTGIICSRRSYSWYIYRNPGIHRGAVMHVPLMLAGGNKILAHDLVAREWSGDDATISHMQVYTWNNLPTVGAVLASRHEDGVNSEDLGDPYWGGIQSHGFVFDVPLGSAKGVVLQVENMVSLVQAAKYTDCTYTNPDDTTISTWSLPNGRTITFS